MDLFDSYTNVSELEIMEDDALGGTGGVTNLPTGIFDKLVNLQRLDLRRNPFTSLPNEVLDPPFLRGADLRYDPGTLNLPASFRYTSRIL